MASVRVLEFVRQGDGTWQLPAASLARLTARFPEVAFHSPRDRAEADGRLAESDVVLGWAVRPHNFAAASRLRWIHLTAAGVGGALFPELVESPVTVTNARGLHGVSIAEHVLGVMLAFARRLHLCRDAQRDGRWIHDELSPEPPGMLQLSGARLGLVGLGSIGGEIASRARAFGMSVRAVTRKPRPDPSPAHETWPLARLAELAASSDWLVLAAPLTPATRGVVGRAVLEALPPHAVLVNIGRGALVDEATLIERLERGAIAGAALDVFVEEPLPEASPLWRMPQVVLTPHVSGYGPRYWERVVDQFAEILADFLAGRPLRNVVDKREGY